MSPLSHLVFDNILIDELNMFLKCPITFIFFVSLTLSPLMCSVTFYGNPDGLVCFSLIYLMIFSLLCL